ncbi:enoyl-CoA hydratase [Rhodococcus sp. ACS1]|uniref:enoyl-CoA hydratase-related protein n=1 Tax=Rhodococcus sp. ACS1 TaxID=2028570 RepID=UPI000BB106F5|nr:enoyl-CoA hydratase-related protein [Rhodococcus sp. ACS1]PBC35237.1 enoyl-CoA hydratase [Rhodococcus sp. ACS1]
MVHFEQHEHIAVITLDRPEVRNAIDLADAERIEALIDSIEMDDSVWMSIITGTGTVFCSGANLAAIAAGGSPAKTARGGFAGLVTRSRTKPMIAAVNGPAVAGGCEIVLACDLVVASSAASFGLSEVKRSMVAAGGGLYHLPQVLPRNIAMELAVTGDRITAQRAYELGLVNELVEPSDLMNAALALADRVGANAPLAVRETRRVLLDGMTQDATQAMAVAEDSMTQIRKTEDFAEGARAFLEKRTPQWRCR